MRIARTFLVASVVLAGGLALAGCVGERASRGTVGPVVPVEPAPVVAPAPAAGDTVGNGAVKVALLLPLSGPGQAAAAARSLRNAAELSLSEFQGADLQILVKDDRGTADGAREAAQAALGEGAELILGPLFASSVSAAGGVAKAAAKPAIGFSTDGSVARPGVYLLSFLPGPEVDRVVDYAASQGRKSVAALIPETVYGNVVEAALREAAARAGVRVAALERYPAGQPGPAVERIRSLVTGPAPAADLLFLPDSGDGLVAAGAALTAAGFDPARVKPIGTGIWNDPRTLRNPALAGGWYAAPDGGGFASFSGRYRARFGQEPTRLATLSYDAVSLAAALQKTQGKAAFTDAALQSPSGFTGVDGAFRFKGDGTNDRALAVMEIRNGTTGVASPAPRTLSGT